MSLGASFPSQTGPSILGPDSFFLFFFLCQMMIKHAFLNLKITMCVVVRVLALPTDILSQSRLFAWDGGSDGSFRHTTDEIASLTSIFLLLFL